MRYNGLQLAIEMAITKLDHPYLKENEDLLFLGTIREDVIYIPWFRRVWEHWSFSHFYGPSKPGGYLPFLWPSAPSKADFYYEKSVQAWKSGNPLRALVLLGQVSHLVIDMACPTHAQRVAHSSDGYEWYVEAQYEELKGKSFSEAKIQNPNEKSYVFALTASMANLAQKHAADRTHHLWGEILKKLGLRKTLSRDVFKSQAEELIPACAGHLTSLYKKFLQDTGAVLGSA